MAVEPKSTQTLSPAQSWKRSTYMTGAALGLVIGLLAAYLFARTAEENPAQPRPNRIQTMDALKLALALLGLIRQVAELGKKN